jgi:hypothetical protein
MKKSVIFLLLGVLFLLISFILFATLKESVIPNCANTCGKFIKYSDAFTPEFICNLSCLLNQNNQQFIYHNPLYVIFVWLGIISILLGIVFLIFKK